MISPYIVWFAAFSLLGWVFECVYAVVTTRHWESRGFLFGPLCPIYGVGGTAALVLFGMPAVADAGLPLWAVFLLCMAGSAVLEYVVSFVLEKAFGAVWWDYSNLPLNLNGRICLPASLLFGVAGVLIVSFVLPFTQWAVGVVPPVAMDIAAFAIVALVAADTALTVVALTDLMDKVNRMDDEVNQRMESIVAGMGDGGQALPHFLTSREWLSAEYLKTTAGHLTALQRRLARNIRRVASKQSESALAHLRETIAAAEHTARRGKRR